MTQRLLSPSQSVIIGVLRAIVSRANTIPTLPTNGLIYRSPGRHHCSNLRQQSFCYTSLASSSELLSTSIDEDFTNHSSTLGSTDASTRRRLHPSPRKTSNGTPCDASKKPSKRQQVKKKPAIKPKTAEEWNWAIMNAAMHGRVNKAIKLFRRMEKSPFKPDKIAYTIIVNAFCKQSDMIRAWKWVRRMRANHVWPDVYTFTSLIDGYMKEADIDGAEETFRLMMEKKIEPSITTYNVLMHHSVAQLDMPTAVKFWNKLTNAGLNPDVYTYAILIHGMGDNGQIEEAWELFRMMQSQGIRINEVVATDLMGMHVKNKENDKATILFRQLFHSENGPKPNRYTRNVLLNAAISDATLETLQNYYGQYTQSLENKNTNLATLFSGPCVYTYTAFMRAFLRNDALQMVSQIYNDMLQRKVRPTLVTYAVLMLAHAKIPDPEACQNILKELRRGGFELNVILYTIVVRAWAQAGRWNKVIETVNAMKADNVQPNKRTLEILQWNKDGLTNGLFTPTERENREEKY